MSKSPIKNHIITQSILQTVITTFPAHDKPVNCN